MRSCCAGSGRPDVDTCGARLETRILDFFAGGACEEETLRANEKAFGRIGLVPRVPRCLRHFGSMDN